MGLELMSAKYFYIQAMLAVILFTAIIVSLRLKGRSLSVFTGGVYRRGFKWSLVSTLKVVYLPSQTTHEIKEKYDGISCYPFQHLTAIWHSVEEVSYELRVVRGEVNVLFHVFSSGFLLSSAFKKLKECLLSVKASLETRFPGLLLSIPPPEEIKEIFKFYQGKPSSNRKKALRVTFPDGERKICVLSVLDGVDTSGYGELSQIDILARSFLQLDTNVSFVVCFKPIKKKVKRGVRAEESGGLWKASCYVILELEREEDLDLKLIQVKNILATALSSPTGKLRIKVLSGTKLRKKYFEIVMRKPVGNTFKLSSLKLATLAHLPRRGVPGLSLRVKPEFNVPPERVLLGDGVKVGYVTFGDKVLFPFNLKLEHLRKGVAVLGSIGSGKTRMIMKVARDVAVNYRIPVLVFESKGEFASLIKDVPPDFAEQIILLRPGSSYAPLKINLFDPGDMIAEEYGRRLFGLLNVVFRSMFREDSELTVQMARVLSEVLSETLKNEEKRSIDGFFQVLREYGRREVEIPNLLNTISALEARMNIFRRGILGNVFDAKKSNVSIDDLLGKVTIIDFSHLFSHGGTKEDAQLIMNLVMLHVFQAGLRRANAESLAHLVIVDDARFLVPEIFVRRSSSDTTAIEDMITLERGKGQGLIIACQDPSISRIALANCNTRIVFRLSFKSQSEEEFIRMSLNLPDELREFLLTQPNRSAIVKIPEFPYPFPIITQDYKITEVAPRIIEAHNRTYHPFLFEIKNEVNVGQILDQLLEWIITVGPVTLEQVARELRINLSDARRILTKLEKEGYITSLSNNKIYVKT